MESTLKELKERRSCRSFRAEPVSEADLAKIMEAATYAPTGMNRQHPIIVVVENPELVKKLSAMNAACMPDGYKGDPFYGAPCVAVVFGNTEVYTWIEDGSLVLGNMLNAAHAAGVGSCWIHRANPMFKSEEGLALKKEWGIPDSYEGVGNCILGYPAAEPNAPAPRKADYVRYIK